VISLVLFACGYAAQGSMKNASHLSINVLNCSCLLIEPMKKYHSYLFLLIFIFFLGMEDGLSQSVFQEEKEPQIRLGNVTFYIREIESTPSRLKILEAHIEIFNRNQQLVAPPNSIKVVLVPIETKYKDSNAMSELALFPGEVTLNSPLPPRTGRVLVIGFLIPEEKLGSITFEVQINPPEGEKKTVTWEEP